MSNGVVPCERHGLHYDPTIHSGCVVCRRGRAAAPRWPRVVLGITLVACAAMAVVGIRARGAPIPPIPSAATAQSVAPPVSAAPAESADVSTDDPEPETSLQTLRNLEVVRKGCDIGSAEACRRVRTVCAPENWSDPFLHEVAKTELLATLERRCGGDASRILVEGCVRGVWKACVRGQERGAIGAERATEAMSAACDARDRIACQALRQRFASSDRAAASAIDRFENRIAVCEASKGVACDVPYGGWRTLVAPKPTAKVAAQDAPRPTEPDSPPGPPGVWREPPRARTSEEIAEILRDAGVPQNENGVFVLSSSGGIGLGFDPKLRSPELGLRKCSERIMACMMMNRDVDKCVATNPVCVSATPWLGDPAGIDCCPAACIAAYQSSRRYGHDESEALQTIMTSGCYGGVR